MCCQSERWFKTCLSCQRVRVVQNREIPHLFPIPPPRPPRQIHNCLSFSHVCWTVKLTKSFQVSKLWSKWTSQQTGKRHKNSLSLLLLIKTDLSRNFWLKYENNVKIWQRIWLVCRCWCWYILTYLLCTCIMANFNVIKCTHLKPPALFLQVLLRLS